MSQPGDRWEREADAMADRVMQQEAGGVVVHHASGIAVQRKCAHCEEEERKRISRKENGGNVNQLPASFSSRMQAVGNGRHMDAPVMQQMSNAFSADFSAVRIHNNSSAASLSNIIGAKAFTYGSNIYFNANQYQPHSKEGQRLLAHELTHVMQQSGVVSRVPLPAEASVTDLSSYTAATRQNIIYDTGFNWQGVLSRFFVRGIVMTVRTGYNVSFVVRGFPATEQFVENPLKALALYNFNLNLHPANDPNPQPAPILNETTVQHLDMTGQNDPANAAQAGPNANVRFTVTSFDATGRGTSRLNNVQILIEKLGAFTAPPVTTETPAARKTRYETTYQFTNAVPVRNDPLGDPLEAMSDAQLNTILVAFDAIPAAILARVPGIPLHRGLTGRGPHGEIAEYSQSRASSTASWERRITFYADFFGASLADQVFVAAHELGHAIDFRPNETATGRGGASLSAARGRDTFRAAVTADGGLGKGMSTYAATRTDFDEYYAEAFAMYLNQRETLRLLRPHVYEYFVAQFP